MHVLNLARGQKSECYLPITDSFNNGVASTCFRPFGMALLCLRTCDATIETSETGDEELKRELPPLARWTPRACGSNFGPCQLLHSHGTLPPQSRGLLGISKCLQNRLIGQVNAWPVPCLVTAVSVTPESQGLTVASTQMGVLGVNGIGWWIVRFPEIGGSMTSTTMRWRSQATGLLRSEVAAIALMIAVTFFVQAHKKDFV